MTLIWLIVSKEVFVNQQFSWGFWSTWMPWQEITNKRPAMFLKRGEIPWAVMLRCTICSHRTVIWSWMMRRVTAAILWMDTCSVTSVTLNMQSLFPLSLQRTTTTVSFKDLTPSCGYSEIITTSLPELLDYITKHFRWENVHVWDYFMLCCIYSSLFITLLFYSFCCRLVSYGNQFIHSCMKCIRSTMSHKKKKSTYLNFCLNCM